MELQVVIQQVLAPQSFNKKDGTVGNRYGFIGQTVEQYPKVVHFNTTRDETWGVVSPFLLVGNKVNVAFSVSSREWNGKWFTQCDFYTVNLVAGAVQQTQPIEPQPTPQPATQAQAPLPPPPAGSVKAPF